MFPSAPQKILAYILHSLITDFHNVFQNDLVVLMPPNSAKTRYEKIEELGAKVEFWSESETLDEALKRFTNSGYKLLSTCDDFDLMQGYSTIAFEIGEQFGNFTVFPLQYINPGVYILFSTYPKGRFILQGVYIARNTE